MEGDGLAGALGHPHRLSVLHQVDQLHQHDDQPVGAVQSQSVQSRLEPRHMAVVIRTPDVDGLVKAPDRQLVAVVGDVGGKVGVETVGPAEHVVLQVQLVHLLLGLALPHEFLLQQLGGVQPQGAVLLIGPALLGEHLHRLGHIAALMEGGLKEPLVVHDAVLFQILLHLGDIDRQAVLRHLVQALLLGQLLPAVPVGVMDGAGQLLDVLAVIALLREGEILLPQDQLHIPGVDGHGKLVDLVAGVVDIELLPGVAAVPLQHVGQGVPQHAAAGVAHVHGAGGVGGDKLHHDLLAAALRVGAVSGPLPLHVRQDRLIPLGAQGEIQKAGPGDLHFLEVAPLQVKVVHNGLGDGPGGLVQRSGPRHGIGGGVVPVGGILGDLNGGLHLRAGGQLARLHSPQIGRLRQLRDLGAGLLDLIRHNLSTHLSPSLSQSEQGLKRT